ncbi:NUAK family SNF1-like kinase 1 [Mizuhopecten yessoensis]|uniref:NUAK family SNF1-like kinase 1 n=1 Tax=Mizuhopecten yessoensis TaxID=6573 RepID=A0A210PFM8_MIZYE|nr:NUAK family SNF1-like kinase 1 [Mizuhopecten yessoensis]OWF35294.1 NUAK family SNF1-like kinase 1 [Mizuhopecten yessoensis]
MPARMMDEEFLSGLMEGGMGLGPALPVHIAHKHNLKHRFELIKTLGEGSYGKVKLAIEKSTKEQVAIKYIKKGKINDDTDLTRLRREIRILSSLNHPNIVNVREVFENKDRIILVMDCATSGELYDYINNRSQLAEADARRIFRQIVSAVHCCHQNGIVHRDLKLENIVLDHDGNVKIADFGLSNYFSQNKLLSTYCGSPLYASPEIVNGNPYHGPEVDCWSLGVVLYTLVYGAMPFDSSDFKVLRKQISNGDYYEPTNAAECAGLIRHLLTVNPAKRAGVTDILNHWWVNLHHNKTPCGAPYPNPDFLKPVTLRHNQSLSSDSEGEVDMKSAKPLKSILKKPSSGSTSSNNSRSSEDPCDTACRESKCHDSLPSMEVGDTQCVNGYTDSMTMPEQGPEVFCSATEGAGNSSEEIKKVFDSEKKPARGILKRKGKFSGGDSGCVLNENSVKSPGESETKENTSMTYNLSDIDQVLHGGENTAPNSQICRNQASDFVHSGTSYTPADNVSERSVTVVPRRGILKQPGTTDARKRLSACSIGSNSSAEILDFSYDSGDDQYLNLSKFGIVTSSDGIDHLGGFNAGLDPGPSSNEYRTRGDSGHFDQSRPDISQKL